MSDNVKYQIRLVGREVREAKIRAGTVASSHEEDFYDFRNQKTRLKVIRPELGLLIYRMRNFRTFSNQKEFTAREGKPPDYFQTGQENESLQQLQHEILVKLARTGRAGTITPVIDVLKKEKQREPLLVTASGVVVNGNRRLAAMRELYESDSASFPEFSHVDCMVLPEDATPEDLIDVEASLQARPETKLDYDWIGDCQLIQELLNMGRSYEKIGEQLHRKDIESSLRALIEADLYLKDWARSEGQYSRVQDAQQFFMDLPDLLKGKPPHLIEASRVIAWTLYDNKDQLGDRLYAFNVAFGKKASDVLDRMADSLGLPLAASLSASTSEEFEVSVDDDDRPVTYQPIIDALRDPELREEICDALIEVCRNVIEAERTQKTGNAALKSASSAHAKLMEIDLSKAAPTTYAAIGKQLDAVIIKAGDLRTRLANYPSEASKEVG